MKLEVMQMATDLVVKIPLQLAAHRLTAESAYRDMLGFPVKFLGHSTAPVLPKRTGDWWVEPLVSSATLPPRAQKRLAIAMSRGPKLKAVVLFHEIPTRNESSLWHRLVSRITYWYDQELPSIPEHLP